MKGKILFVSLSLGLVGCASEPAQYTQESKNVAAMGRTMAALDECSLRGQIAPVSAAQ